MAVELRGELEPLADKFADVPLDVAVRYGRAADELIKDAGHSDLVIVGRHRPRRRLGSRHLGSIVRAVLRESGFPVMIVNPADPAGDTRDDRT